MLHRLLLPLLGSLLLLSCSVVNADDGEVVRFNFRFGFFDDDETPDTDIMKEDIEGVLCQTQYFMSQLVQNATGTKSVHAQATEIDWGYYEGQELPAHINFTVVFSDAAFDGDVNWVDDRILITQMEALGTPGLQKYITDWVWESEPKDFNFFANANRMAFDGVKQAPVMGQLEEAECPETVAPTHAPTVSASPTQAPTPFSENTHLGGGGGSGNVTTPGGSELVGETNEFPDENGNGNPGGPNGEGGNPNGEGGNPGDQPGGPGENGAGLGPDGTPLVGPAGNVSRANWPFGPNYNDLDDLAPMADFSLSFAMFEDHENPPASAEVNALICQVNEFFTTELRRKLQDGSIHMKAVFVDWFFDEGGAGTEQEDIKVNFTAFAYYGQDEHDQVPVEDVFQAMQLTEPELRDLVENYVWKSEPEQENVFFHTESMGMSADVGGQPDTQAMLIEASGCVLPLNDDGTPFGGVAGPTPDREGEGGDNGQSFNNGAGFDPAALGFDGDAKKSRITVAFRVSNLENIKEENAVKASGLDSSFPVFTNELVNELAARDAARRFLGRGLRVVTIPDTSAVEEVNEFPCPSSALPGLTCHSARAKYDVLMSSDEDPSRVYDDYTAASETAVNDGTYNNVLQRVDPDTPLFIGIMSSKDQIPPGSVKRGYDGEPDDEDDGWFKWWYILLLLLLLLLCCLCCLYCWMLNQKDEPVKETTVEEREILVEEFEDEDVPQDRGIDGDGDDEEEFIDDTGKPDADDEEVVDDGAGVMVPYDPNQTPPPEAGQMVPYDPDGTKAHADQIERDRILNSSQRGEEKTEEELRKEREAKEKADDQVWEEDN